MIKSLGDFDFGEKNVLLRCDFNVPVSKEGEILDDFRIRKALPTLRYLIKEKARAIIISHLEPKTGQLSQRILVPRLEELLGKKIIFLVDYLKPETREKIDNEKPGQVILLENIRFHKEEKENDRNFAEKISKLGDIFVNEAFSVCHRDHASTSGVPRFLPRAAGILLEKEIGVFSGLLENPDRPFIAIIGGIKIETKIKTILNILNIADHLILGSKIGEVIFAHKGIIVGRKLKEEKLIDKIDLTNPKIHLPVDGVIALKSKNEGYLRRGGIGTLKKEEDVYDIGPESLKMFKKVIKKAKTILWNGTLGMHEDERFEKGTREIADSIVRNYSAFKVAGGGETVSAIHSFRMADKFDFLSTGGGAMLEFLAGEKLPGIEALRAD